MIHSKEHNSSKYTEYLIIGIFIESVFENWESEFSQMGIFVLLTEFL
ncbi:MAG: DUF6766 family protein, partial [Ignavibacteria bacterium]